MQIQQLSSLLSDWSPTDKDTYRYCQPQKKKRGWEKNCPILQKKHQVKEKKTFLNLGKEGCSEERKSTQYPALPVNTQDELTVYVDGRLPDGSKNYSVPHSLPSTSSSE